MHFLQLDQMSALAMSAYSSHRCDLDWVASLSGPHHRRLPNPDVSECRTSPGRPTTRSTPSQSDLIAGRVAIVTYSEMSPASSRPDSYGNHSWLNRYLVSWDTSGRMHWCWAEIGFCCGWWHFCRGLDQLGWANQILDSYFKQFIDQSYSKLIYPPQNSRNSHPNTDLYQNHQPLNYKDMSEPDPWGNYI